MRVPRNTISVNDVFKTQGQPTVTYISRNKGAFEAKLSGALDSKGALCLLTGPSKTGKTSLYSKVLSARGLEPLRIRCNADITPSEFWRSALEKLDFDRVKQLQQQRKSTSTVAGELSGTIGWKWLAGLTGKASTSLAKAKTESEIRERVLSEASPDHLVPVLRELPVVLVVEDFHYLSTNVQHTVFQQWKVFVDNEVSVLIVGTTHHAADLAHANKDLVGRVIQIELTTWAQGDLSSIAEEGFKHLAISVPNSLCRTIATESVGLPIITQAACLQLLASRGIIQIPTTASVADWKTQEVYAALHQVAIDRYKSFETIYDRLTRGPRKKARRYNTYELVLSSFTLDEVVFSLHRDDIISRVGRLPVAPDAVPPPGSLQSTFRALGSFQKKLGIEILEWSDRDQKLYVLEPAFLFFLRWRKPRTASPTLLEMIQELLEKQLTGSRLGMLLAEIHETSRAADKNKAGER